MSVGPPIPVSPDRPRGGPDPLLAAVSAGIRAELGLSPERTSERESDGESGDARGDGGRGPAGGEEVRDVQ